MNKYAINNRALNLLQIVQWSAILLNIIYSPTEAAILAAIAVAAFLHSENHLRNYNKGKNMVVFGCSASTESDDDKIKTSYQLHLTTIFGTLVLIVGMLGYNAIYSRLINCL
ncbi:hypothetical protein KP803_10945 [Vibrio sp. ZSDE26]|uniref:Uncharacterized protein n=1 Tax=Vibrio amylolyticus TaxID=2847292 RepID=A0A9X1XL95_9VIBR|nr:hypothetical protein [Vibrio amylolyticus]MCK6263788.1 hypothetical protein [Vibrio amylolyticus]